jgi:hypothetical protein
MAQLSHSNLGALKGILTPEKVRQFHNLPFDVAERFGVPTLLSGKPSGDVYDASRLV